MDYSITFELTGKFVEYTIYPDRVRALVYDYGSSGDETQGDITRKEFAALLIQARNDRDKSLVRWKSRRYWRR